MISLFKNNVEIPFKQWKFPGGEVGVQLWNIDLTSDYVIRMDYENSDDVFVFLNVCDALLRSRVASHKVQALIPYFPYARQDRVCNVGESFALNVFCNMIINAMLSKIVTYDIHSNVSALWFGHYGEAELENKEQYECARNLPLFNVLIAPDKGATEKAKKHKQLESGTQLVQLSKTRLENKIVYEDHAYDTIKGTVCVVDDLSDGNGTFIVLAEMLKRTQPNITSLNLYVTHGLFSKGVSNLYGLYDTIYTHNLMNKSVANGVTII